MHQWKHDWKIFFKKGEDMKKYGVDKQRNDQTYAYVNLCMW